MLDLEDHYKEQNFVLDAMRLKCSADRLGVELPFHIIYGGGLMEPRPDTAWVLMLVTGSGCLSLDEKELRSLS